MKRLILLLVLLLLACGKGDLVDDAPELPVNEGEPAAEEPVEEEPKSAEPAETTEPVEKVVKESEPEPEVEVKEKENSPEVKALLQRYESKVTSYEFYYAPPPDNLARDHYFLNGDRVKIELFEENFQQNDDYFDTIYLNLEKKTAKKYCVNGGVLCKEFKQGQDVSFDEYNMQWPHEYIDQIEHASITGSETLYDRRTMKLSYELGGLQHYAWVDEYSGLPVRIQKGETKDDPKWEFRELGINSVAEEDVTYSG